jgi:hypothetical protein
MFGTKAILIALSLLLVALAALVGWQEQSATARARSVMATAVALAVMTMVGLAATPKPVEGFTVRSEAESLYGWVRVVDDELRGLRLMLSDASVISAVDVTRDRSVLDYQHVLGALPMFRPETTHALLKGRAHRFHLSGVRYPDPARSLQRRSTCSMAHRPRAHDIRRRGLHHHRRLQPDGKPPSPQVRGVQKALPRTYPIRPAAELTHMIHDSLCRNRRDARPARSHRHISLPVGAACRQAVAVEVL